MLVDVEQNSVEWLQMRVGMVTASRLEDVVKRLTRKTKNGNKGDYAAARHSYLLEICAERLTGRSAEHFVTPYMEAGIENEPLARAAYEMQVDDEVLPGKFAIHPAIKWFGASVDARVGAVGGAEFKCLKPENHLQIIQNGVIPVEFAYQMVGEIACYELDYCDFVSFCPWMPKPMRLFVRRMQRNDEIIAKMEDEVLSFVEDVAKMLTWLGAEDGADMQDLRGTEAQGLLPEIEATEA